MRLLARIGNVAEFEIRDWRVVRAEGELAPAIRLLVAAIVEETASLPDVQRRVMLPLQLQRLGLEIVQEEWPPFPDVPEGSIP